MRRLAVVIAAVWVGAPAAALDLALPASAQMTFEATDPAGTYFLPIAPYADDELPTLELNGRVVQQAWRLPEQAITTQQIMTPLRDQIAAAGYDTLLDCHARECGGFDFRFATQVLPAPDMIVDLLDYRFISAGKPDGGAVSYLSVLVSRANTSGYVQIVQVLPQGASAARVTFGPAVVRPLVLPEGQPLLEALNDQGHAILADLEFGSGSASLGDGPFASLEALAAYLKGDSARRVALVGHTDAVGGLDPNLDLSRRRAASVLERLVTNHGVPRAQLESSGVAYLSPVAPNNTPQGRDANRRVEVVLLSSENAN